jgi:ABC-type Fe3+-citrate transport system substrate-binding protein
MPTIEERLQALEREHQTLEQEHTQLKKTIELQTIAIRALVSKEAFEKLQDTVEKTQEQNTRIFDALMAHDRLTNEQLADLRSQQIEEDGKIVGLQTEMRQRFAEHTTLLQQILARLPEQP